MNLNMDSEENSYTAVNETYKVWKKHVPFLYSVLQTYELPTCSQTVEWMPHAQLENDWKVCSLLIGTSSVRENAVQVVAAGVPTDDSLTDCCGYREEKSEFSVGGNGFIGTLGQQRFSVKTALPQRSEVMRARVNRVEPSILAVRTGGAEHELIVYDLRRGEEGNEGVALEGHSEEGFGLAWSPHQANRLLSGSYDKKIMLFNAQVSGVQGSWECGEGVEDVKWSNFNHNIFASAHTDEKVNIWDIRSGEERPLISRRAHSGEVYSLDFSPRSEFLLLSGGEDGDVNLWDVRAMAKKLHSFAGHSDSVNAVSWSPHSPTQFASGSSDRRVLLWDMGKVSDSGQEKAGEVVFIHGGHRSRVTDLSWSREEEGLLASCEEGNVLQVWRVSENVVA